MTVTLGALFADAGGVDFFQAVRLVEERWPGALQRPMSEPEVWLRGTLPEAATVNLRCESLTLKSESKVPFEVDGEFVGYLPATFSMRRMQLRVIVPPAVSTSGSGKQKPAADFATPSASS